MEIIKALKWRYATKKFDKNRLLSEDKITVLKKAFNLTATSYGLQPIKLVVVQNKGLQQKLMDFSWGQKQISTASHVLIVCIEKNINEKFIETYIEREKNIRATPEEILTSYKEFLLQDFGKKPEEEIKIWALNQAYLAMGTLLTVCAAEEIDSCPMEGFASKNYDELLELDKKNLESVLVLPVGYRATDDEFSTFKKVRRPLSDVIVEIN